MEPISITLLVVIGFLLIVQVISLAIITYLAKRILDEKPVAIKETVEAGAAPTVVTRQDLKAARKYTEEQNFDKKAAGNYTDLESLSPEQGMDLVESYFNRGEK